jgi:hypothetical protein
LSTISRSKKKKEMGRGREKLKERAQYDEQSLK